MKEIWKYEYFEAHKGVVRPMTRNQVFVAAVSKKVVFTERNLDNVFGYEGFFQCLRAVMYTFSFVCIMRQGKVLKCDHH